MNISYVDFSKFLENQGITKSKYKFLENFSKCNQLLTIREFLTGFIKSSDKNNLSNQIFKKYVDYDDVHIKNIFKKLNLIKIRMNKNIKIKYLHLWLKKCFIIDNNFISLRNKNKLNLNSKNKLYDDYKYRNNYLHILKIISSIKEGEKSPFKPKVNKNFFITINTTSNNNNDDFTTKNNKFKTINSTSKTKNKISHNIVNDYLKRYPKRMFSYKPKISKINLRIKDDYYDNPYIYPNYYFENESKNKYNENNKNNSRFQNKSLLSNRINETDPNKNNIIYRKFRNPISSNSLANANTNLITDTLNKSDKFNTNTNNNNNNNNNNYFGTINSINSFQDKNFNKLTITNFDEAYFNDKKNINDFYVTKENLLLKSNYPQYNKIILQNVSDRQLLKKADALIQPDESVKRFLTIYEKQKKFK